MKSIMKTSLKVGLTAGILTIGSLAYSLTKAGKDFIVKVFEKDSPKTAEFFEGSREDIISAFEYVNENATETYKKRFDTEEEIVKDPETGELLATSEQNLDSGSEYPEIDEFTNKMLKKAERMPDMIAFIKRVQVRAIKLKKDEIDKSFLKKSIEAYQIEGKTEQGERTEILWEMINFYNTYFAYLDLNIDDSKFILTKVFNQANETPLETLMTKPIFEANWGDARNLFYGKKSNELTAQRTLTEDDKTMLAMDQYYKFKGYTSTRDIIDMRAFLFRYNNDASYMSEEKTTDEFVVDEYLRVMREMEKKFEETKELKPEIGIEEVEMEDLW